MPNLPPQCQNLEKSVEKLIELTKQENTIKSLDFTKINIALNKAISPRFEIVFAGAYSAGKSMLINALFEQELLYSSAGHATGTECQIQNVGSDGKEKVILTFLSKKEIFAQIEELWNKLRQENVVTSYNFGDFSDSNILDPIQKDCNKVIDKAGGKDRTKQAEWANAIILLIQGLNNNQDYIQEDSEQAIPMATIGFQNLSDAVEYVRQGFNSSVLRRVEYFYKHKLLEGGNVIIDTPGIDAPVARDADLTYKKIENPDTSAVVCVFQSAMNAKGELSGSEKQLLDKIQKNPNIGNRVFNVFNYIDNAWYNVKTAQLVENLIKEQFHKSRVYKTSALLGFYGSQIKKTDESSQFGLETIFSKEINLQDGNSTTPQFISEFLRYCSPTGRLRSTRFKVTTDSDEKPNDVYQRILKEQGFDLVDHLIDDSGINEFRQAITDYLTKEKSPQLYKDLGDKLLDLCRNLRSEYQKQFDTLIKNRPNESLTQKEQVVIEINKKLWQVGEDFYTTIRSEINQIMATNLESSNNLKTESESSLEDTNSSYQVLREKYSELKTALYNKINEIDNLSMKEVYHGAVAKQDNNSTVPISMLLSEPFEIISEKIEEVFKSSASELVETLFNHLIERMTNINNSYIQDLLEFSDTDAGIEQKLRDCEAQVAIAIDNHVIVECDRYRREDKTYYGLKSASYKDKLLEALSDPQFYPNNILSADLKNQIVNTALKVLQLAITGGTSEVARLLSEIIDNTPGFGNANMTEAQETTIKRFLKENFQSRVDVTLNIYFPQILKQTLKTHLNRVADEQKTYITQLAATPDLQKKLDALAKEEQKQFKKKVKNLQTKVSQYKEAISEINGCLSYWELNVSLPSSDIADRLDTFISSSSKKED
ncbi:MAG: dynamin family protein [Crocosphaera sp.]|nr:dynamin family protein [Crocosphaera sp.]